MCRSDSWDFDSGEEWRVEVIIKASGSGKALSTNTAGAMNPLKIRFRVGRVQCGLKEGGQQEVWQRSRKASHRGQRKVGEKYESNL